VNEKEAQVPQYLLLSVGRDPLLMRTRTVLLGEAGYSVMPSFTSRDAFQIFVSRDIDLVILCHTIPQSEKGKLIVSMKERNKRTPIVSIHADGETDGQLVDAYVHSLDGPEALLSCVAKILDKSTGRQIVN
jgi:DNA-binding response OmpR family regulator